MLINIPFSKKPYITARRELEIIDLRRELRDAIKMNKRIICIDETIFLGRENKFRGWAEKGKNVEGSFSVLFEPNTCEIAAISHKKLIYFE